MGKEKKELREYSHVISKSSSNFKEIFSFERNLQNGTGQLQTRHLLGKKCVCVYSIVFSKPIKPFLKISGKAQVENQRDHHLMMVTVPNIFQVFE